MNTNTFLPTTLNEAKKANISSFDIILITGDAYIDHPSFGIALIGRLLQNQGYTVGIIAMPNANKLEDFKKLGRPNLFFGITSGNIDSMVSNYTASRNIRETDDYLPKNSQIKRPNRALIRYANKAREAYKEIPVIIGGLEASLRRLAHYDYWEDKVRRSILSDSKADILVYGMGEKQITEIAIRLKNGNPINTLNIPGTAVIKNSITHLKDYIQLNSFEEISSDKKLFNSTFKTIYQNQNPYTAKTLVQKHGDRYIIINPPAKPLTTEELDLVFNLPYTRKYHPSYENAGGIKAFETIKFSMISHRGCTGECSFCSLYMHQGRIIVSRSKQSLLKEAKHITSLKDFKGTISDIGGPTANLFNASCSKWKKDGYCADKKCLTPKKCPNLHIDYQNSLNTYEEIKKIPNIKNAFIGSGFRYDLLLTAPSHYIKKIYSQFISGRIKIAPEHTNDKILKIMNKPQNKHFLEFINQFKKINDQIKKRIYMINYFILSHPGTTEKEAKELATFIKQHKLNAEQVQDFIPLPLTLSGTIFYTGEHPITGEKIDSVKKLSERKHQRALCQKERTRHET